MQKRLFENCRTLFGSGMLEIPRKIFFATSIGLCVGVMKTSDWKLKNNKAPSIHQVTPAQQKKNYSNTVPQGDCKITANMESQYNIWTTTSNVGTAHEKQSNSEISEARFDRFEK